MKVLQPGQRAVFSPAPSCNPHSGVELGLTDPVTSPLDYQGGLGISGDGGMAEELWGQTRMGQGRAEVGAGCRGWRMCSPLLPAGTAASLGCPSPEQGRAGQCRASSRHGSGAEPGLIPLCTLQEWADVCCRGLRSVHAYILVYDICCFDSFEYIKTIRQQILETR